ncbi:hypothetical protein [Romboutsia ilealis]|uniref:hypothetical protein n=1 Tax=Romboutsia ilealis TaxID=1115758 RepID=UPI00272BEB78|nr:hypothetical protein [Romboutsia ilealis]
MEKDISYIKSAIDKINEDSTIKFLLDLVGASIKDAVNFEPHKVYRCGDKVYLYKDGKHRVYKCIVDISTPCETIDEETTEEWSDLFY